MQVEVKQREHGAIIEIVLPNKTICRIESFDNENAIRVQAPFASLLVKPCVTNEVKIIVEE